MPLDISNAEDSFLHGRAEFNQWSDEFMIRWYKEDMLLYLRAVINTVGLQGLLQNPTAVLQVEKLLNMLLGRE